LKPRLSRTTRLAAYAPGGSSSDARGPDSAATLAPPGRVVMAHVYEAMGRMMTAVVPAESSCTAAAAPPADLISPEGEAMTADSRAPTGAGGAGGAPGGSAPGSAPG
jgi:hypothetical protein